MFDDQDGLSQHAGSEEELSSAETTTSAIRRKRERDKLNQRRKRQRDREHARALEAKVRELEQRLAITVERQEPVRPETPSHTNNDMTISSNWNFLVDMASGDLWTGNDSTVHGPEAPSRNADDATTMMPIMELATPLPSTGSSASLVERVNDIHTGDSGPRTLQKISQPLQEGSDAPPRQQGPSSNITILGSAIDSFLYTPQCLRFPSLDFSPIPGPRTLIKNERIGAVIKQLRASPDPELCCPSTPKTLDLLFGGSKNTLANMVATELTPHLLRPPEKFAVSWLLYLYTRWLVMPSQDSFAMIPKMLRPTTLQLLVDHPLCLDMVFWPELRDRLILHWKSYDLENVFGLLGCTARIRGWSDGQFIRRMDDNEPNVDQRFRDCFLHPNGWALLERFWVEYPNLVEGLDRSIMMSEDESLPP